MAIRATRGRRSPDVIYMAAYITARMPSSSMAALDGLRRNGQARPLFVSLIVPATFADAEREYLDEFRLLGVPVLVERPPRGSGLRELASQIADTASVLRSTHQRFVCLPSRIHWRPLLACALVPRVRVILPAPPPPGTEPEVALVRSWWSENAPRSAA